MKTRISVIIPVYNVQEFLKECVDSVLDQTINSMELTDGYERNLQILLIDDGSTDDSGRIAKDYAENHENVEYIYEENQGLGHARNYGCTFAEGDYIIFLDSDDLVTPEAYERMYKSAVKNDVDMAIGNVTRFTSKNTKRIKIHKTAFSSMKEVTHITESPELFYDTTAWNKLIKRSFWDKHDFKFPEGILYEDIPVTMPMHYLANKVSVVYETCYLWRIREGLSKSITQTTDQSKNLNDRLTVMRMVDDFFKKNVSEKNLLHEKTIKWLNIDLKMYIDSLTKLTEEDSVEYRKLIIDYIKESIDLDDLKDLSEINQLKYKYLLDDEFKKLTDLINFEKNDLKFAKVYSKGSDLMIDVDERIFGTSPFCITQYIKEGYERRFIQKVALKKNELAVKGFIVIPGLKDDDVNDREYSFYLFNSETKARLPLKFDDVKSGDLSEFEIPYGDNISYDAASFRVHVPYEDLIDNPDFIGENRIQVTFKQEDIVFNYFLDNVKRNVRNSSKLKARIYENTYFSLDYDVYNELVLSINPIEYCYEEVSIKDGLFCIHSPEYHGELFLCYEEDLLSDESKKPLIYNEDEHYYSIDLMEINPFFGQIRDENDVPIVYNQKKQLYLTSDKSQIVINALRDYHFDILRCENISLIQKIKENEQLIDIKLKLYTIEDINALKSAALYLKDPINYNDILIANGNISDDNISFKFDFSDKKLLDYLYIGVHDFYAEYVFDDAEIKTQVFLKKNYKHRYSEEYYDYNLYRSGKGVLRINSTQKWPKELNTPMKRKHELKSKYEQFRKLPVHPKRIMFESLWAKHFNCNPRYLYEYINENYPDYECIWSLEDEHKYVSGNAIRVRKYSLEYYYYLATSKFVIDNANYENEFVKRDEQIYIQTMHGTPLKSFGLDIPTEFVTEKSKNDFINRCARWDYLLVQSDYVAGLTERCFAYDGNLLKVGYPRTDLLYSRNNKKDIDELKKKLDIPLDKKVILYAPTWRMRNDFEMMIDLKSFKESLSDDYILILRMHHFAGKGLNLDNNDFVYDFSKYNSMEELYLVSDILVTDYSSAMFDYAILDRPIILFTYDMDEYVNSIRGIYFDLEDNKPGPICYTSKELEDIILNIDEYDKEYESYRKKFQDKFNQYEYENSSELIFDKVFKANKTNAFSELYNKLVLKIKSPYIK